jgi:isocitrate lyase
MRMSDEERRATPEVDFAPWIIADADTGHGGDAHVRNLVRRFVEVGVPGYHIEDQKPGAKKCGHQGGKVLVPSDEQIKRLNAARLQLDVMGVAGIIVARTDAEAANLLDGSGDERDQPFILGVTSRDVPAYRIGHLAVMRRLERAGVTDITGHRLYAIGESAYAAADAWLDETGLGGEIDELGRSATTHAEETLDAALDRFLETWQAHAGLKTLGEAIAEELAFRTEEGAELPMSVDEWRTFAAGASWQEARHAAAQMGITVVWDPEPARTPEGYYQVRGGIPYAIAKSLAAAPYADILWMETKTADLADAREFAEAIHAVHPDKMLAYNLSPSFNWDTTGMTDEEMRAFPEELGQARVRLQLHHVRRPPDRRPGRRGVHHRAARRRHAGPGPAPAQAAPARVAVPDAADARRRPARRRRAPRRLGPDGDDEGDGPRVDPGAAPRPDRGPAPPPCRLARRLGAAARSRAARGLLRPHTAGSEVLELTVTDADGGRLASVIFATITDRRGRSILSVRDQATDPRLRRKRLMTLIQLFLMHRYRAASVHYLTPTDDNRRQCERMLERGIFEAVNDEVGEIIVAEVDRRRLAALVADDSDERSRLIEGA